MFYFYCLVIILIFTLFIESSLFLGIIMFKNHRVKDYELLTCLLGNIITNPVLNILFTIYLLVANGVMESFLVIYFLEVCAVCIEALLYHKLAGYSYKFSFFLSLALNLTSYILGVLVLLFY